MFLCDVRRIDFIHNPTHTSTEILSSQKPFTNTFEFELKFNKNANIPTQGQRYQSICIALKSSRRKKKLSQCIDRRAKGQWYRFIWCLADTKALEQRFA